jgi:hypothetical protein
MTATNTATPVQLTIKSNIQTLIKTLRDIKNDKSVSILTSHNRVVRRKSDGINCLTRTEGGFNYFGFWNTASRWTPEDGERIAKEFSKGGLEHESIFYGTLRDEVEEFATFNLKSLLTIRHAA